MNTAGLYVVPRGRKVAKPRKARAPASWPKPDNPEVEIDYMHREGARVVHTYKSWRRPQTAEAVDEWMGEYFERVAAGYVPAGFDVAPEPFCARVTVGGRVVVEWSRSEVKRASGGL